MGCPTILPFTGVCSASDQRGGCHRASEVLTLSVAPVANHAGEEGAEARVGVQGRELQRAPEVLDVALAGIDGLLDVVERVAVFAAAGLDAGERGEGGGVSRVSGYGPL